MRTLFITITISVFSTVLTNAQQRNLDSLLSIWQDESQPDSLKVQPFTEYIWYGFLFNKPDTAIIMANELINFGIEKELISAQAKGFHIKGNAYERKGQFSKAIDYFEQSQSYFKENKEQKNVALVIGAIGTAYARKGDFPNALVYFGEYLKLNEDLGDSNGIARAYGNFGIIYSELGEYPKALINFKLGLKIHGQIGDDSAIEATMNNIAVIYSKQGDFKNALIQHLEILKAREEKGTQFDIATSLSNIGGVYTNLGEYSKGIEYFQKSLNIRESMGDKDGAAEVLQNMGTSFLFRNDFETPQKFCLKSYDLAQSTGSLKKQKKACECLYDAYKGSSNWEKALEYFELIQQFTDSLKVDETKKDLQRFEFERRVLRDSIVREKDKREIEVAHQKEITEKNKIQYTAIGGGALVMLLAIGLFARLRYTNKTKKIIEKEKNRSDKLLLNILPAEVAEELKNTGASEAQQFDQVSILFTDFKSFTQTAEKLSAKDLVNEINTCFKAFDHICEKYHIEKIKTIGDSYMAAAGLGSSSQFTDDHSQQTVNREQTTVNLTLAALEMQQFITARGLQLEANGSRSFQMRAGIHTGPVVAGIVGVKKFQYDIWGDTVNTASRMESHGEVGMVNISEATYEILKSNAEFSFEAREELEIKGKGMMKTFFVSINS